MKSRIDASRQARTPTAIVTCPDCGEKIILKGIIHVGLGVPCPNCEAELEVVQMMPVELDWVQHKPEDEQEILARW